MSLPAIGEWLLIIMVALIVIGPKDLPKALYHIGRFVRTIRGYMHSAQQHLDHIVNLGEIQKDIDEQKAYKKSRPKKKPPTNE